jgi:alcohol dehydrogenase
MEIVFIESGEVTVRSQRRPRRPSGSALIRLLAAGICGTDLELLQGYYGFRGIPGHEFVGEVVESDQPHLVGKRVVGEINIPCGSCDWCRRGLGRHCPKRSVLGIVNRPGAFQEYFILPDHNLHVLPDAVSTEDAVFTEPIAAAWEILEQVTIPAGAVVAVLGDGKLGLLIARVLHVQGAEVRVHGHHRPKLKLVEADGIETVSRRQRRMHAAYDWVVEATGSRDGLEEAVKMVRPRGTLILKSTLQSMPVLDTAKLIVDEITLVGSRCGPFEPALRLLERGQLRVDDMVSARLPLRQAPRAFELAASKGVLKVLLIPDSMPHS